MSDKKQAFNPESWPPSKAPYSRGIGVGDMVFVAGQGPIDIPTGKVMHGTIEEETELTIKNVEAILKASGCTLADCVKATVHLIDMNEFNRFNEVYRKHFPEPRPARTTVQSVLWGGIRVEIDVIAIRGSGQA